MGIISCTLGGVAPQIRLQKRHVEELKKSVFDNRNRLNQKHFGVVEEKIGSKNWQRFKPNFAENTGL